MGVPSPLHLPPLPPLGWREVVVVDVGLEITEDVRASLSTILDGDERARAGRFVFPHHRRHYVAAHAALRLVLAHYLDRDPATVRFERNAHGKPRLATASEYEFNLTHSAARALVAVARGRAVGIDIELHRFGVEVDALARSILSPAEQCAFAAVQATDRRAAFFRAWTRKESFVKAIGEGLSCPLGSFDVSLDEHVGNALLACRHALAATTHWTTVPLDVGAEAAAAITVAGSLSFRGRAGGVATYG